MPGQPQMLSAGLRWLHLWGYVALALSSLGTAAWGLAVACLVLAGVVALPAAGAGLLLLVPGLWLARWTAAATRGWIAGLTGIRIDPPAESTMPAWRRLFSAESWRAAAFCALQTIPASLASAGVGIALAQGLLLAAGPAVSTRRAGGVPVLWFASLSSGPAVLAGVAAGLAIIAGAPPLARLLTSIGIALARWLIGQSPEQRIADLAATRRETLESVEAERRRIERDLHDGPQQRLVAIAMDLGMARESMRDNPELAGGLLESAHASIKEAITEMRRVARGIVPPILADRGLDAAISAIATRCPVPVQVHSGWRDRTDPTLEAIAYFVVSEALTNIAKHSTATLATVETSTTRTAGRAWLHLRIQDNGRGGANPALGTGLSGLRQRVGAVDGRLTIDSPQGGPTTIDVSLPLPDERAPR